MAWRHFLLLFALVPGLFAWWSGRRVAGLDDDPAVGDRLFARSVAQQQVLVIAAFVVAMASPPWAWPGVLCAFVGAWVGDYPSRKRLFDERFGLGSYLAWLVRFQLASVGFWWLLALAPTLIHGAGPWRWPVAAAVALVLAAWHARHAEMFVRLVGAQPVGARAEWLTVTRRSTVPAPRLLAFSVPGGSFAAALALPSSRAPAVLVSDSLLALLDCREQAAILAHQLARLERHDRRRRRRLTVLTAGAIVWWTFGAALALHRLPPTLVLTAWTVALGVGVLWWFARRRVREADGDLRALELCGDAEALVSGLVKLTTAGRVPRRFGFSAEHAATHPRLSHRLYAIRRAAGIAPRSLERPVVVASTRRESFVILGPERVSWLDGVSEADSRHEARLRETAKSIRSMYYSELLDLRVRTSVFTGVALVARDVRGRMRAVPIDRRDVPMVQLALDIVDERLAHATVAPQPPPALGRVVAAVMPWLVVQGGLFGLALVAAAAGVLWPSRAALAGLSGVAAASALAYVGQLAQQPDALRLLWFAGGLAAVAAAAAWLALPARNTEHPLDVALPLSALAAMAAVLWTPLVWHLASGHTLVSVAETMRSTPALWTALAGLGAVLLTVPGPAARRSGAGMLVAAAALGPGAVLATLLPAPLAVPAEPAGGETPLQRVERVDVPGGVGPLEVSPRGRRVAVRLVSADPRFAIFTAPSQVRSTVSATALHFVDDDHVLLVFEEAGRAVLRHLALAESVLRWQMTLDDVHDVRLASVRFPEWAGSGYDRATFDFVGLFGRLDDESLARSSWLVPDVDADDEVTLDVTPGGRGFRSVVEPMLPTRPPWGPLLYGRSPAPRQTQLWALRPTGEQRVAAWAAPTTCRSVAHGRGDMICVEYRAASARVWRFDLAAGPVAGPTAVPGVFWRSGVSRDGALVALWGPDTVAVIDLDTGRLARHRPPPAVGLPAQLVPLGDRVIAMFKRRRDATVDIYHVRW